MFFIGIPPTKKKSKTSWWPFTKGGGGTLEQTGNSTLPLGNGKGPEAKKEDCKDQPRKKPRFPSNWPPNPPKTKNNTKTQKKKTRCSKPIVERSIGFFFVWFFLFINFLFAYHCITFKSICLQFSFSSIVYYSKSTFNKPSRGHRITLRQSFPHVMGIKE